MNPLAEPIYTRAYIKVLMSDTLNASVMAALKAEGKQGTRNRKWVTAQLEKERTHQMSITLLNAFSKDPELKYFMGMAGGAGVAWVGSILGRVNIIDTPTNGTPEQPPVIPMPDFWSNPYLWLGGTLVATAGNEIIDQAGGPSFDPTGGLQGNIGSILQLGGTGFAGTCAMILILKSIFSGTDLGELLSGVGEIVPL